MTLDQASKGDCLIVTSVDDPLARVHAIRFGVCEGACIDCVTKIPAGPVIVRSGRQEIAVGRKLARRISVRAGLRCEGARHTGTPRQEAL